MAVPIFCVWLQKCSLQECHLVVSCSLAFSQLPPVRDVLWSRCGLVVVPPLYYNLAFKPLDVVSLWSRFSRLPTTFYLSRISKHLVFEEHTDREKTMSFDTNCFFLLQRVRRKSLPQHHQPRMRKLLAYEGQDEAQTFSNF